jgi:hypothetical protein
MTAASGQFISEIALTCRGSGADLHSKFFQPS